MKASKLSEIWGRCLFRQVLPRASVSPFQLEKTIHLKRRYNWFGTISELPLIGITTYRIYQLLELPIRLVGIPNWLEILIRIARNYQHSKLPIFGIFNGNTECEPGYGLRYGLGYGLIYG